MATINELSAVDALATGDLLAVYDTSNGDARKSSLTTLMTFLEANLTFPHGSFTRQAATVAATGYSVSVTDSGAWIWLFITQGAGYAAGTVVFPATPVDQQEIMIKFSHTVTALTLNGNGKTIVNGPTDVTDADVTTRFKYDSLTASWYTF